MSIDLFIEQIIRPPLNKTHPEKALPSKFRRGDFRWMSCVQLAARFSLLNVQFNSIRSETVREFDPATEYPNENVRVRIVTDGAPLY